MRTLLLTFSIAVIASGCAVKNVELYDAQVATGVYMRSAGTCTPPSSGYKFSPADGIQISFASSVVQRGVGVQMSIAIEEGHRLQLDQAKAQISLTDKGEQFTTKIRPFILGIYGKYKGDTGYLEEYPPLQELIGKNRNIAIAPPLGPTDVFLTSFVFDVERPEEFTLTMPSLLIDGRRVDVQPIRFKYRAQRYVSPCIQ